MPEINLDNHNFSFFRSNKDIKIAVIQENILFKPELAKNTIIRNPDRFTINAVGSYSPNGNSVFTV